MFYCDIYFPLSFFLVAKGLWDKPDTEVVTGHKPEGRMGHTAVYDPTVRSIYVYGGSKNIRWFNDVHVLELDTMKWQLVQVCQLILVGLNKYMESMQDLKHWYVFINFSANNFDKKIQEFSILH